MTAKPVQADEPVPVVTDLDAIDDGAWLDRHLQRRFRARRKGCHTVLVRRVKATIMLRTITGSSAGPDTDIDLADRWFSAAYPSWSLEQIAKAVRKTLKRERP